MTINTYRVVYRYDDDDTEYAALVDETSPAAAVAALLWRDEPVIVVRVELVD